MTGALAISGFRAAVVGMKVDESDRMSVPRYLGGTIVEVGRKEITVIFPAQENTGWHEAEIRYFHGNCLQKSKSA